MTFNPDNEQTRIIQRMARQVTLYPTYEKPIGFLCNRDIHRECHAMFYYGLVASKTYEQQVQDPKAYEGDRDSAVNFLNMIKSIALLYDVPMAAMVKHWPCVSMQAHAMGLPLLPDEERYRFNR